MGDPLTHRVEIEKLPDPSITYIVEFSPPQCQQVHTHFDITVIPIRLDLTNSYDHLY